MCLNERWYQAGKKHLIDFRDAAMTGDEARDAKVQNQITKRVQKENQR